MNIENEILIKNSKYHNSCGYHDLSPFSPDEKHLIFCSIKTQNYKENIIFSKEHISVNINLFNIKAKKITFLYETNCYTTEQGVRINWIDNKRITINSLDKNNNPEFVIFNIETSKVEKIIKNYFCHQIAGLKKELCISFDYSSIQKMWPSYGFHHKSTKYQPKNSLNIFNWKTNQLIHRFNLFDLKSYKKYKDGFIVHPSISKDGKKIIFMHRIPINKLLYSWLYYVDLESLKVNLITEEKVSHFAWINNDSFIIYQRLLPKFIKSKRIRNYNKNQKINTISSLKPIASNFQKKIKIFDLLKFFLAKFSSGFVIYNVNNSKVKKKLVSLNLLGIDCHPFFDNVRNKLFLDSYPNKSNEVGIYSINLKNPFFAKKEKFLIGDWLTNLGKVDAHIRVSSMGNYICIDDVLKKRRSIKIFKIKN